jgi:hypothetical protein
MDNYIAPFILLIVLFVGFGLLHRNGQNAGGCSGCTGSCSDKSECSNEDKPW